MKIALDLDEVIADTLCTIIQFHNDTYGTRLTREQFTSYRFWEIWGGTREEAVDKVHAFHRTSYAHSVRPVAGAQDAVCALGKENDLYIVTSRANEFVGKTEQWLATHFPGAFAEVHFANHYSKNDRTEKSKADICEKLGVQMLVEDSVDFAIECAREGRDVFLLDRPWNQTDRLPSGVYRVSSWEEIMEIAKVL